AVRTSTPVRLIEHGRGGVTLHYDGGTVAVGAVGLAMEPGQVSKIEFSPSLPPARDRLRARWLAGHGAKYIAVYDRPFWREEGLAGEAVGDLGPFGEIMDVSPTDGDEGILLALYFASDVNAPALDAAAASEAGVRAAVLDAMAFCFGPQAYEAQESCAFDWSWDHWSQGCGTARPPGALSTVGHALHPPVGRLVWAGADNGTANWMEGAVRAGHAAALATAELLNMKC
ncbi:FAD-dependent oxidoreductase, partial [Streptomyces sp. NPDC006356]